MIIISKKDKESIQAGNTQVLKRILKEELEKTKEGLIDMPSEKIETLRGEARLLREILKLL
jgi:hypothetical protein